MEAEQKERRKLLAAHIFGRLVRLKNC